MNELDSAGARILTDVVPSLKTISSHRYGDFDAGCHREFGLEPWNSRLFALPRITGGYCFNAEFRLEMISTLAQSGIWVHFFHPDDIFDNPVNYPDAPSYRNPGSLHWNGKGKAGSRTLLESLHEWFSFADEHFPWLRYLTTSDASEVVQRWLGVDIDVEIAEDQVGITSSEPVELQIRIADMQSEENLELGGCELLHHYRGQGYSLLTLRKPAGESLLRWKPLFSIAEPRVEPAPHEPGFRSKVSGGSTIRRLCLVADTRGWAFDAIARGIASRIGDDWEVNILYENEFASLSLFYQELFGDGSDYDLVHYLWCPKLWLMFERENLLAITSGLNDAEREAFFDCVSSVCKTTSIYDHLSHDPELLSFTDGYSVASARLHRVYSENPRMAPPAAIIPDAVDTDLFSPDQRDGALRESHEVVVGWAGNSAWGESNLDHKGLRTIIQPAVEQLQGEGVFVRAEFADRQVSRKPKHMIPAYYRSLDIYVCASLHEGTPNPVLEVMACGLPVLSTDVGVVRDVFGPLQQEFIVEDRQSPEFIDKLRRLVLDHDIRQRLGDENLLSIRDWDWKHRIRNWASFFEQALQRRNKMDEYRQKAMFRALWRAVMIERDAGEALEDEKRKVQTFLDSHQRRSGRAVTLVERVIRGVFDWGARIRVSMTLPSLNEFSRPAPAGEYRIVQNEEENYLQNEAGTIQFNLNPQTALIWRLCDGHREAGEIVWLLEEHFPDSHRTIRRDVFSILKKLQKHGVLRI